MAFFGNNNSTPSSNSQILANRYNSARYDVLAIAIFTFINLILLAGGGDVYFVFSASIPYGIASLVRYMCGLYPEELYEGGYAAYEFLEPAVFYVVLAIAAVITLFYVLFFIFSSKNRVGWLIAALSFFSADTLFMLWYYGLTIDMLMDVVFHAIVIVILAMGISAHYKLKKILVEEPMVYETVEGQTDDLGRADFDRPDSTAIRTADMTVKSRVLLEVKAFDHVIVYRRVKTVNELVIDGYVYDEYVARMEMPHVLTANIDGHAIAVGYNGNMSYATIDGQQAATKARWY